MGHGDPKWIINNYETQQIVKLLHELETAELSKEVLSVRGDPFSTGSLDTVYLSIYISYFRGASWA